jgi:hypothetical protein
MVFMLLHGHAPITNQVSFAICCMKDCVACLPPNKCRLSRSSVVEAGEKRLAMVEEGSASSFRCVHKHDLAPFSLPAGCRGPASKC